MDYGRNCPACNARITRTVMNAPYRTASGYDIPGVRVCPKCQAVFGECYLGESYDIIIPCMDENPNPPQEDLRYYDLTTLGSKGIQRTHGWFNIKTRRVVQVG